MIIKDLIPAILFAFSSTLTPGPNNFMLLNAGLNFGITRSLGLYCGVCLGFPLMVLIVALGFGEVFTHYPLFKTILKILGSLYMLYLAWQILNSHTKAKLSKHNKPLGLFQVMLFQWINPKAWLMAIGAISIFTLAQNPLSNAIAISGLFFLMCLPCSGVWLVGGTGLQKILKEEWHRRLFNALMAIGLVASIALLFLE